MSSAAIIIESQPPHVGQFLAIRDVLQKYDNVIICIIDKPMVMSTARVIATWTLILEDYSFSIVPINIEDALEKGLPDYLKEIETILVSDKHIFVALNTLGVDVGLLGHVKGYNDVFIRAAYRQGLAYDYLIGLSQY